MGLVASVVWEAMSSPIVTMSTLAMVGIWVKFLFNEWDTRYFSQSYADCVVKKQLWRVLLAPMSHHSVWHLLLNALTLWGIRSIEQQHGSWFFFRYSVLLAVSESVLAYLAIFMCIRCASAQRDLLQIVLSSLSWCGCSGVLLGWLAFFSVDAASSTEPVRAFLLFGLLSLHPVVVPLVMIGLYYLVLHRNNVFSNLAGLMSGYLLRYGALQVLPGWYWSLCFLFDLAFLVVFSMLYSEQLAQYFDSPDPSPSPGVAEYVQVVAIGADDNIRRSESIRDLFSRGDIEMGLWDNNESTPLLSSGTAAAATAATAATAAGNTATAGGYEDSGSDSTQSDSDEGRPMGRMSPTAAAAAAAAVHRSSSGSGLVARSSSRDAWSPRPS